MKATDFPIFLIYSSDEGAWLARVEQLAGLVVDGATQEEALSNAKTAIINWIETTKELGRDVPKPLSEEQLIEAQIELNKRQSEFLQKAFNQAIAAAVKSQKHEVTGGNIFHYGRGGLTGGPPYTTISAALAAKP